ncbi:MAG: class F sortase [Actinobacteria bacterium]|nr:class F sortase [Actinomycetota bacterium]
MPVAVPTEAPDVVAAAAAPTSVVPVPADPRGASWLGGGAVLDPRAPIAPLAPDPLTLTRSVPTRVRIPAIAVDSALVGLGLQDDGSMEVPPGAFPAGWYTGAPTPGELGPAIFAGHVDHGGSAGVFARLHDLQPGDAVEVTRQDGTTVVFRVTRVEQHSKDAFPTAAVYGDIDHAGLRLITCGGPFDRRVRSYEDNIVVFAELDPGASDAPGRGS